MFSRKHLTFIKDFINNESVCHFMVVQLFKLSTKDKPLVIYSPSIKYPFLWLLTCNICYLEKHSQKWCVLAYLMSHKFRTNERTINAHICECKHWQ